MSSTGTAARRPARVVTRFLSGLAVTLVLGIVGMHALSSHGPEMSGTEMAGMEMSAATGATSSDAAATSARAPGVAPGAASGTAPSSSDHGTGGTGGMGDTSDTSDMVMLCVAMLASAGALVLVLLALRRAPPRWGRLRLLRTCTWSRAVDRLPAGPPPAWRFSVIRC